MAVFSLMMLRSVVKAVPPAPAPAAPALTIASEEPPTHAKEHHPPAEAAAPADDRPRLRLKKGATIRDDLVEIVREDPDAAADILRAWIGKAG